MDKDIYSYFDIEELEENINIFNFNESDSNYLIQIYGNQLWSRIDSYFINRKIRPIFSQLDVDNPKNSNNIIIEDLTYISSNKELKYNFKHGINFIIDPVLNAAMQMALIFQPDDKNIENQRSYETKITINLNSKEFEIGKRKSGNNESFTIEEKDLINRNYSYNRQFDVINFIVRQIGYFQKFPHSQKSGYILLKNIWFFDFSNLDPAQTPKDIFPYRDDLNDMELFGSYDARLKFFLKSINEDTISDYNLKNNENNRIIVEKQKKINQNKYEIRSFKKQIEGYEQLKVLYSLEGKNKSDLVNMYDDLQKQDLPLKSLLVNDDDNNIINTDLEKREKQVEKVNEELSNLNIEISSIAYKRKLLLNENRDKREEFAKLNADFKNFVECSCGANISEEVRNERIQNGLCPICGQIPPNDIKKAIKIRAIEEITNKNESYIKEYNQKIENLERTVRILTKQKEFIVSHTPEITMETQFIRLNNNENLLDIVNKITLNEDKMNKIKLILDQEVILEENEKKIDDFSKEIEMEQKKITSLDNKIDKNNNIIKSINERINTLDSELETYFEQEQSSLIPEVISRILNENQRVGTKVEINDKIGLRLNLRSIYPYLTPNLDVFHLTVSFYLILLELSLENNLQIPKFLFFNNIPYKVVKEFEQKLTLLQRNYPEQFQIILNISEQENETDLPIDWNRIEIKNFNQDIL